MATRWETFPIKLEGGLIENLGRLEQGIQAPGSAKVLQNFEPDINGGYTRITGYTKFNEHIIPGTGVVKGVVAISANEALAVRNGAYYYSDGTAWVSKLALANPAITKIRKDYYNFTGNKKFVTIDSVNPPAYYDTVTKTMAYAVGAPADVVGATRLAAFKAHLFFSKGRLLSFTSPYLEDDFNTGTGAGVINVGDTITGLAVFRDELIIFCINSIYRLSGNTSSDFVLSQITSKTGCLCGDTIQEVGGDLMYLGPDGVRYLSASQRINDFGLERASEKIQKRILSISNTNCYYSSTTIASKNQYRLFNYIENVARANSTAFLATKFSNQSATDISWATIKGMKVYDLSKVQERDKEVVLFASDTDYLYRMDVGNSFDGSDIEAVFETPFTPITDPKVRKTIYKHTLYAKPTGAFAVEGLLKFDYNQADASQSPPFEISGSTSAAVYGDTGSVYGSAVYGPTGEEQYYNNVVGSGFVVAVRYSNTSSLPPFNINFTILEYRQNERR